MLDQMIVIYCICDEVTKTLRLADDVQCKMTTAEVMTFALSAAMLYKGDYRLSHLISRHSGYFKNILSISQLVRRIHAVSESAWQCAFLALKVFLANKDQRLFIVDSLPVKAYENHKSFRARIFSGRQYHGYSASRKQYYFGLKIHMIVDADGVPVEFSFSPASTSDIQGLRDLPLHLPKNSTLLADRAYTDYSHEDLLLEIEDLRLIAKRRSNSRRPHGPQESLLLSQYRNRIETVFSGITSRMPRYIKARTERGFCLKVMLFILVYMVARYFPLQ